MTDRQVVDYLRKQGWMPELAGPGPDGHLAATEETAAGLPQFATDSSRFEPIPEGQNLQTAIEGLTVPTGQLPVAPVKPWQAVAEKAGTIPTQSELIEMAKGETSLQFSDMSSNFQKFCLAAKRRSDAVAKVSDAVNAVGEAVNKVVDDATAAIQKRQCASGEWPAGFEFEGAGRRCPDCRKYLWKTEAAWRHVHKGCPEKVRIARAMAEYRPALQSL